MAESVIPSTPVTIGRPRTLDEARSMARRRFRERLERGEQIGNCDCAADDVTPVPAEDAVRVIGVRFIDSGRLYYFDPGSASVQTGDWVAVETSRGREAARVILAPQQVRMATLDGELKPIVRVLDDDDIARMQQFRNSAAAAVKLFGRKVRERNLPMKPISAEYSFDGSHLTLNYSSPDRVDFRDLAKDLSDTFRCRVELRQIGPRDEARLLGGLGRCGRTLCCSSWLPVYPEISMNLAKTQDLPLNPGKVSGVCGRLLCCLSYENEQYKQMRAVMPRLGQIVETPIGPAMVVAMQILKETVTVRAQVDNADHQFQASELRSGPAPSEAPPVAVQAPIVAEPVTSIQDAHREPAAAEAAMPLQAETEAPAVAADGEPRVETEAEQAAGKRRRRGRGRRREGNRPAQA